MIYDVSAWPISESAPDSCGFGKAEWTKSSLPDVQVLREAIQDQGAYFPQEQLS